VLEQSWRLGGASSAELLALQAFADDLHCNGYVPPPTKYSASPTCPLTPPSFIKETTVNSDNSVNLRGFANMAIQSETVELQVENDRIAGTLVSPGTKMPGILFRTRLGRQPAT
jgi:hypothetical protein